MRLTIHTDYALRLLIYLAARSDPARATIGEIADAYGIARNHLTKVAHRLGRAGHVATVRGKGGGLRLARPAARTGVGEVVRCTEPDLALVPCFAPVCGACPIVPACGLRGALEEARQAFLAVLDRHTLADLAAQSAALRALLAMPPDVAPAPAARPVGRGKPGDRRAGSGRA